MIHNEFENNNFHISYEKKSVKISAICGHQRLKQIIEKI